MLPIIESVPLNCRKTPLESWAWRLLTGLPSLVRRRLTSVDPEELPPHLRRDLGLTDLGLPCNSGPSRDWWIR
jgi:hypothetical protein